MAIQGRVFLERKVKRAALPARTALTFPYGPYPHLLLSEDSALTSRGAFLHSSPFTESLNTSCRAPLQSGLQTRKDCSN
jgi:hypothetical protein